MKVGTKSLLFGVHQVFIHPICVALAWRELYGFSFDLRVLTAFVVHDWGYWGKKEIDGPEGDRHPEVGADIMHFLFDGVDTGSVGYYGEPGFSHWRIPEMTWYYFALHHSRFLAKQAGVQPSKLCMADKLAVCYYPTWLFIFLSTLSGEIKFFMDDASQKKHATMGLDYTTPWTFVRTMKKILRKYAFDHKDGQEDTLT
jgi:hypothetical protein